MEAAQQLQWEGKELEVVMMAKELVAEKLGEGWCGGGVADGGGEEIAGAIGEVGGEVIGRGGGGTEVGGGETLEGGVGEETGGLEAFG
ncbi:hypothetical protein HPP92_011298 [Vanilla planifolia]|uniref:Uncharacterized protein n=1 Tax=Vanilla planifolia TaxID=51239 RepID=A0A835R2J1_VANPL|nr:hypothetical protein HPP92_011298 [Vanilla planifolia]